MTNDAHLTMDTGDIVKFEDEEVTVVRRVMIHESMSVDYVPGYVILTKSGAFTTVHRDKVQIICRYDDPDLPPCDEWSVVGTDICPNHT